MKSVASYTIKTDGQEFPPGYKVRSILVYNEVNKIPRAKIVLLDGDVSTQNFTLSNKDFFKPGVAIEISLGYGGEVTNVFTGIVIRHSIRIKKSGESLLEIECKHLAVKLTLSRGNRLFFNKNDNEAVTEILQNARLTAEVTGMDLFTHEQLVQFDSTAWDFIMSRIEANGCLAVFGPVKLLITPPTMEQDIAVDCQYGVNVISFDAQINAQDQFQEVEGISWNASDQEVLETTEQTDFVNETGNLTTAALASALGNKAFLLTGSEQLPEQELSAWAKSRATRKALSKIQGLVSITGNAAVSTGKSIRLSGLGDRFNGPAYVTGVRNEMVDGNWTTHIQLGLPDIPYATRPDIQSPPAAGMLPAVRGIHIGIVTGIQEDPEAEFRIRVKMPAGFEEGIWARVSNTFAGNQYGATFLPEVGDEVVLGFLNDDPRKAIILGGLHSSAKPPALTPDNKNDLKGFVTRSDMRLIWDDGKKSVTISTPAGNNIKIDEDQGRILIEDKNKNSILLSEEGIVIDSAKDLKINAKMNVQINGIDITLGAKGKFATESVTGAELKTSGIAVLQGSLIQIN
jgi:Rhs element Vgr protein